MEFPEPSHFQDQIKKQHDLVCSHMLVKLNRALEEDDPQTVESLAASYAMITGRLKSYEQK